MNKQYTAVNKTEAPYPEDELPFSEVNVDENDYTGGSVSTTCSLDAAAAATAAATATATATAAAAAAGFPVPVASQSDDTETDQEPTTDVFDADDVSSAENTSVWTSLRRIVRRYDHIENSSPTTYAVAGSTQHAASETSDILSSNIGHDGLATRVTAPEALLSSADSAAPPAYQEYAEFEDDVWSNQATCAGAVGGVIGLALGGVGVSFVCATGCMVAAKEEPGRFGQVARACGDFGLQAVLFPHRLLMERGWGGGQAPSANVTEETDALVSAIGIDSALVDSSGTIWMTVDSKSDPAPSAADQENPDVSESKERYFTITKVEPLDLVQELRWCVPCTPGTITSTRALEEDNDHPSFDEKKRPVSVATLSTLDNTSESSECSGDNQEVVDSSHISLSPPAFLLMQENA